MLGESVVTFDDAAAAQKALANYVEQWERCANTRFSWTIDLSSDLLNRDPTDSLESTVGEPDPSNEGR